MTRDLFDHNTDDAPSDVESDASKITLTLVIHDEKPGVIFVTETGDGKPIMLPRSEIDIVPTGQRTKAVGKPKLAVAEIVMPIWLAKDRGLI